MGGRERGRGVCVERKTVEGEGLRESREWERGVETKNRDGERKKEIEMEKQDLRSAQED